MKITGLRSFMQRVGDRPRLLVRVDTDEGISGWGEAYNHGPDWALPPILDYIYPQIEGIDPRRIEFIALKLLQSARFPPGALGLAAFSAVEHALWDISGKAAGLPVFMLLGGHSRDRVRVYLGVKSNKDPAATFANMQRVNERYGFDAFKLSPFLGNPHAERWGRICDTAGAYSQALRGIAPPDWDFAYDAHAKIFEPIQAIQLAAALAPSQPMFLEEPLRPEHIPAWSRLRSQMTMPLATGECLYNRFEFLALMAAGGADIVQPDICVIGGLLEMRKIAAIAEAHCINVAPHNPMGPLATAVNLHFCAAQPNVAILEYKLPDDVSWCPDPYLPREGYLDLRHDRPGWGIEIDARALETEDYVHWERKLPLRRDGSTGYT